MTMMKAINVETSMGENGVYYDIEYARVEDIAKEKVEDFFLAYAPYDWDNENREYWFNLIEENPKEAYEYFDENKAEVIVDVFDEKITNLFADAIDSLYDCCLYKED